MIPTFHLFYGSLLSFLNRDEFIISGNYILRKERNDPKEIHICSISLYKLFCPLFREQVLDKNRK